MTTDEPAVTTGDELNEALSSLLRRAHERGVDVEGGWDCRNGGGHPDWDVVVTEVESNVASE